MFFVSLRPKAVIERSRVYLQTAEHFGISFFNKQNKNRKEMNMKMKWMPILLTGLLVYTGCNENTDPEVAEDLSGSATMEVYLTDAPASYEAVLIDVQGLEYAWSGDHLNDSTDSDDTLAWETIEIEPQVYDLLALNNGDQALLADLEIPAGNFREIRFILGDSNWLVSQGDTTSLKIPSGGASGLKIKVDGMLEAGKSYHLILDFDAARSVVRAGNSGRYLLKPVIKAHLEERESPTTGSIAGVIVPDSVSSVVYAIYEGDSASSIPEDNGSFLIDHLMEGNYRILAIPDSSSGYDPVTMDDVSVMAGETTDLDTLHFE